ncbi:MAG: FAD-dependent oxidoreductase [Candidatus Melainabacteria bacterium]|nr:MAG: FAD-dependent oxidoreductase [Candidatus Melainabacteria bacterium]
MSMPISRATFLKGLAGCGIAAFVGRSYFDWIHADPKFPCRMLGPSKELGHLLRDSMDSLKIPTSPPSTHCKVTIVGGGMAGLSAGWWLQKQGLSDFVVLDLEHDVGGNSSCGKNDFGSYPWGAHYVPICNPESVYVREFFEELNIIQGHNDAGLAIYDELMLCHEPQERLWKDGSFHDGLVPKRGLQPDENEDIARFFKTVIDLRGATGSDGKLAFAIPLDLSSQDEKFLRLDGISMEEWLDDNKFNTKPLRWYVNYCCRDDYGSTLKNVSAWAGLHYFVGRRGVSANSEPNAVITWPQGNGYLVEKLKGKLKKQIETGAMVVRVEPVEGKVVTTVMDAKSREFRAVSSDYVIFAAPRFVADRVVVGQKFSHQHALNYAPWMVANITLKGLPDARGLAPAWDNVSYYSDSLGYVMANHQDITTRAKSCVITYYYPLSDQEPREARRALYSSTPEHWSELIVKDLQKMHPTIANEIVSMDLWPWGHGMIRPSVGFIWGNVRRQMKESAGGGSIIFAHSDMSGMSNFEEAQYHGVEAAKTVLSGFKNG